MCDHILELNRISTQNSFNMSQLISDMLVEVMLANTRTSGLFFPQHELAHRTVSDEHYSQFVQVEVVLYCRYDGKPRYFIIQTLGRATYTSSSHPYISRASYLGCVRTCPCQNNTQPKMGIRDYALAAVAVAYGAFTLIYFSAWALLDGSNWTAETPERVKELEKGKVWMHADVYYNDNTSVSLMHDLQLSRFRLCFS